MGYISTLALALAAISPALAAPTDGPATPRITSIQFSGNGCPNNADWSGDYSCPTFNYKQFTASLPGKSQTVNCEVHVKADSASPGWQVAVSDVNVKGNLHLDAGTRLDYYTQVYFSENAANTGSSQGTITGPFDSQVNIHTAIAGGSQVWSKCIGSDGNPGILNVNFRPALNGDGHASFNVQTENWTFTWRRC